MFSFKGGQVLLGTGQNTLKGSLQFQTSQLELERHLLEEVRRQIVAKLAGINIVIANRLKELITEAVKGSAVYDALVNRGQPLYFELGAVDSPEEMYNLLEVLRASVYVPRPNIRKLGNKLHGSISVFAINSKYIDSAANNSGKYVSTNKDGKTTVIPWLSWLLKSRPIISGWDIKFDYNIVGSRTGGAIMIQKRGGEWRLPIEFAGTLENNFITRAVDDYDVTTKINSFIQQTLASYIG
jgi:hypothetical protein